MILGVLLPQGHRWAGAIGWLVPAMLFITFLQTRLSHRIWRRSHGVLLAANIAMAFAAWGVGWWVGGRDLALAGFFAGITPTATAAPVVMGFLGGQVDYVIAAFLLTNLAIPALLPGLLPLVLGQAKAMEVFRQVLGSMVVRVFAPMAAAAVLRLIHPPAAKWGARLRNVSFGLWVMALFLVTANASDFLRTQTVRPATLAEIAGLTALVCAGNFSLGRWVGGKQFAREGSQSLGQKNTALTIWLALAYAPNPLCALGPTCYVLWHNLWNSWQLHRHRPSPEETAERLKD
jgi:BASS family bile acid:Na+ symporter